MPSFATRLNELKGEKSTSAFARQVGLSEGLIRKYLKGSEPSLSKANQIAQAANCSLEWLATGCGYEYRKAEVVDTEALEKAIGLVLDISEEEQLDLNKQEQMTWIVASYQYLRTTKKPDGYFDLSDARRFMRHMRSL